MVERYVERRKRERERKLLINIGRGRAIKCSQEEREGGRKARLSDWEGREREEPKAALMDEGGKEEKKGKRRKR